MSDSKEIGSKKYDEEMKKIIIKDINNIMDMIGIKYEIVNKLTKINSNAWLIGFCRTPNPSHKVLEYIIKHPKISTLIRYDNILKCRLNIIDIKAIFYCTTNIELLDMFIKHGASTINIKKKGDNLLFYCCESIEYDSVSYLLNNNINNKYKIHKECWNMMKKKYIAGHKEIQHIKKNIEDEKNKEKPDLVEDEDSSYDDSSDDDSSDGDSKDELKNTPLRKYNKLLQDNLTPFNNLTNIMKLFIDREISGNINSNIILKPFVSHLQNNIVLKLNSLYHITNLIPELNNIIAEYYHGFRKTPTIPSTTVPSTIVPTTIPNDILQNIMQFYV